MILNGYNRFFSISVRSFGLPWEYKGHSIHDDGNGHPMHCTVLYPSCGTTAYEKSKNGRQENRRRSKRAEIKMSKANPGSFLCSRLLVLLSPYGRDYL